MIKFLKNRVYKIFNQNLFCPKWYAILFNPCFITRRYLFKNIQKFSQKYCKDKKILDVGCGTKPYFSLFTDTDYTGIDIHSDGHCDNVKVIDKFFDGKSIPYNDKMFDVIVSTQVFEYVEYPKKLLSEIQRTLKLGGYLYLTMPFVWSEDIQANDLQRYTSIKLHELLRQNNFKIILMRSTTGVFGTCGQLISVFFSELGSSIMNACRVRQKFLKIFLNQLIILGVCCPIQLFFYILDILFRKRGVTLDYVIIAQKDDK